MTIIVTGSRNWPKEEQDKIFRVLDLCYRYDFGPMLLIHGAAAGVDSFAESWYRDHEALGDIVRVKFPAKWSEYANRRSGKNPAGAIRNRRMLDYALLPEVISQFGDPLVVAFPLHESVGTYDCMMAARQERDIKVFDMTTHVLKELEDYFTGG